MTIHEMGSYFGFGIMMGLLIAGMCIFLYEVYCKIQKRLRNKRIEKDIPVVTIAVIAKRDIDLRCEQCFYKFQIKENVVVKTLLHRSDKLWDIPILINCPHCKDVATKVTAPSAYLDIDTITQT